MYARYTARAYGHERALRAREGDAGQMVPRCVAARGLHRGLHQVRLLGMSGTRDSRNHALSV
jgi:hypothetical protein